MSRITMLVMNEMRGDARVMREARSLAWVGHEVEVYALRHPGLPDVEDGGAFTIRRVADFTVASLRQPVRKLRERRAREDALRAAVLDSAPDVVHCHDTNTLGIGALIICGLVFLAGVLQGTDLEQAEQWIGVAAEKAPEPTLLQTRYLQSSRQEAVKRQRRLLVAVGAACAVIIPTLVALRPELPRPQCGHRQDHQA